MMWRNPLKRGMQGDDVRSWQLALVGIGFLNTIDVDGIFGQRTDKATIRFQMDHGLTPDGEVGPKTRAEIGVVPESIPTPPDIFDPRWHFVQAKNYTPSIGRVVTMIVMHSMESPDRPDTAEGVAAWFGGLRGTAPQASAHATVDLDSLVLCVKPGDVAWGAQGANACSYHVEQAGFAAFTREQWLSLEGSAMLTLASSHVYLACSHFGLPVVALTLEEVAALIRDSMIRQRKLSGVVSGHPGGICQHHDVTRVWQEFARYGLPDPRKTVSPFWPTHTDCGENYPIDELIARARVE
jgi:hypothetical protein